MSGLSITGTSSKWILSTLLMKATLNSECLLTINFMIDGSLGQVLLLMKGSIPKEEQLNLIPHAVAAEKRG